MATLAFSLAGAGIGAQIGGSFLGVSAQGWAWTPGGLVNNQREDTADVNHSDRDAVDDSDSSKR